MRRRLPVVLLSALAGLGAALAAVPPAPAGASTVGAAFYGSAGATPLNQPIVAMASAPTGSGYWLVAADGGIFSFGSARFRGSAGGSSLPHPVSAIAPTPTGEGYWFATRDGRVLRYGDAGAHGSLEGTAPARPVVGMAATPTGKGYWLVAADGGIFAFGDAAFHGSTGALTLNQPVVGMAATPTGKGYWLVAADGGIFAFGDAAFHGSTGALTLSQPIVGMSPGPLGKGYWLVAADGGIFAFGSAAFHGSTGAMTLNQPIVGMAPVPDGSGYWLVAADGGIFAFPQDPVARAAGLRARRIPTPSEPLRVLVTGDSMAISFQHGLDVGLRATGRASAIERGRWSYGLTASWTPVPPCLFCSPIPGYAPPMLSAEVSEFDPDAFVLMVGGWDMGGRYVDGRALYPPLPEWSAWYRSLQDDAFLRLGARGAVVYWVGYPACDGMGSLDTQRDVNLLAAEAAARNPSHAAFLDLHAEVCPGGPIRTDLVLPGGRPVDPLVDATGHFTEAGAEYVGRWITNQLGPLFSLPQA
ncbi:MAG: hypothetical protein M5U14_09020 [Acidimicrobiia bacterium]|nr:hypothetical protein [Acidimicrobiia bacterium]